MLLMMGRRRLLFWLMMKVFGHILLLVVNQAGSSHADKTIRIGYLLQRTTRAGAINVAVEQAQNDGLLPEYNFRYIAVLDNNYRIPKIYSDRC